jgi:2-methylcitrate dehydratase
MLAMNDSTSNPAGAGTSEILETIADYVAHDRGLTPEAERTAALCVMDALGCALGALADPPLLLGPLFDTAGRSDGFGARVPGTALEANPAKAAFDTSMLIRWLDFSDTSVLGGHPSDNLGAIFAAAEYRSGQLVRAGQPALTMRDVFSAMRSAYEIQGCLASNRLDDPSVGLDHVIYVKLASAAVVAKLLGGNVHTVRNALSNAVLDSQSLNAYRHVPNAGTRKGWAGADAASRGVTLAAMALRGEMGYPNPLRAPVWGFEAVHLRGRELQLGRTPGDYFLERVIFKLVPCQRNGSTAVEAAIRLHDWFRSHRFEAERIEIFTQDEAMRRIVKSGALPNVAARDHCLQYMVAVALLTGKLTAASYSDTMAADPRIDALRARMTVTESAEYTRAHHDPNVHSCANAIRITTCDGAVSEFTEMLFPVGDPVRRNEAAGPLHAKFRDLTAHCWDTDRQDAVIRLFGDTAALCAMTVPDFMDCVTEKPVPRAL